MNASNEHDFTLRDDEEAAPASTGRLLRELADRDAQLKALRAELDRRANRQVFSTDDAQIFQSLIENSQDIFFIADTSERITHIVGNTMGILGYTADQLLERTHNSIWDICHPTEASTFRQQLLAQGPEHRLFETCLRLRDVAGEYRWVELSLRPHYDSQSTWIGYQGAVRDISDRIQVEQIVHSLNAAAQAVLQVASSPERVFQVVTRQLDNLGLAGWILLLDSQKTVRLAQMTTSHPALQVIRELVDRSLPLSLDDLPGYAGIVQKQQPIWAAIDHSLLASLLPSPIRGLAAQLTASFPALKFIIVPMMHYGQPLGLLSVAGEHLGRTLVPAITAFANQMTIAIRNARLFSQLQKHKDLHRETQESLSRAERLRALGQMAAGVAHDFNKVLTSVLGYAEMAQFDLREGKLDQLGSDLRQIAASAMAGADLVRKLQAQQSNESSPTERIPLQIDDLVREALDLTRPMWASPSHPAHIRVECQLTTPPCIRGNAGDLRRVLVNLITNAIEAMPQGGTLSLTTGAQANRSFIQVSDSGIGMTPEQQQLLFEPFYTTKPSTGTGLGLTISQEIVEQHGGEITVSSVPDEGTTFTIYLPNVESAASLPSTLPASRPATPGQSLHVLLLQSDDQVASLIKRLLERRNHTVTVVKDGQQALQISATEPFGLLVVDLSIAGPALISQFAQVAPTLPVIALTDEQTLPDKNLLHNPELRAVLAKPFRHDDLLKAIENLEINT